MYDNAQFSRRENRAERQAQSIMKESAAVEINLSPIRERTRVLRVVCSTIGGEIYENILSSSNVSGVQISSIPFFLYDSDRIRITLPFVAPSERAFFRF